MTEAAQSRYYADVIRRFTCDPAVDSVFFFHLIDETDLDRFQSGLERADGSHRPSYDAVKETLAQSGGRCLGTPVRWRPATGVAGAWARLRSSSLAFGATEDATSTVTLVRLPSRALTGDRIPTRATVVSSVDTRVHAYVQARPSAQPLAGEPGNYVYKLTLQAAVNPRRQSVFLSRPFTLR